MKGAVTLTPQPRVVFISKTMAQPERKQAIFLNHVNLGVIVLQALKIQKVPMVKVIGHN